MSSERFYSEILSFADFAEVAEEQHFHRIPSDWKIIITDVRGSTRAIEEGRYKDVNMVGAAAIACAQNSMNGVEFPFVFGGDGATMAVPPMQFDNVARQLSGLRDLAAKHFGFDLRVGAVDISELDADGFEIQVGKLQLAAGRCVAAFRGGGAAEAERRVKGDPDHHEIKVSAQDDADLSGLSCRWRPIPSRNGKILSLLVVAESDETYRHVIDTLDNIYDGNINQANPVSTDQMRYRSLSESLAQERHQFKTRLSLRYWMHVLKVIYTVLIFKFKLPAVLFDARKYTASIPTHSDYRKFDDALRMVLDCSSQQAEKLRMALGELHTSGRLYYGIHEAKDALMTCFVPSISEGEHIHFVDGGDGGYAMAAKQLKQQMKKASTTSTRPA